MSRRNESIYPIVNERGISVGDFPRLAVETDDTGRFQRAINALSSGGKITIPAGKYTVSSTLNITKNNVTIVGAGYLSQIYRVSPASASHGIYVTGNNCIIMDLQIYRDNNDATYFGDKAITFQSNPAGSTGPTRGKVIRVYMDGFNYGVYAEQATDISIEDCDIHNHTFGTNQGTGVAFTTCTDCHIVNNRIWPLIAGNSEHNVYLAGGTTILVEGNHCQNPATANVQIGTGSCTDIKVVNNTLEHNGHSGVLIEEPSGMLTFQDIIIANNRINDCTNTSTAGRGVGVTITGHYLHQIKVVNNIIENVSEMAIRLEPAADSANNAIAKNIDIDGNTFVNWSKDYSGTYNCINIGGTGETLDSISVCNNNFYPSATSNTPGIWDGTITNMLVQGNRGTSVVPANGLFASGVTNINNSWNVKGYGTAPPSSSYTKLGVEYINSSPAAGSYKKWICVTDNAATDAWKGVDQIAT